MNQKDWQNTFGPTPDEFRERVNDTLNRLEEREMRRSIKFSTSLVAAVLAVALLAGAAFAAAKLDIWEALNMATPIIPLEGADDLVATDIASAENDFFRVTVQEGVYDGFGAIVKLKVEPKDPEKYVIITDFAMSGDLDDEYITEVETYDDGMTAEQIVGRKDDKQIIYLTTPRLIASAEGTDTEVDVSDLEDLFSTIKDCYNSDGSAEFWISGIAGKKLPDTLSVALNVRGMDKDYNTAYGSIENLAFDMTRSSSSQRTIKLVPASDQSINGFELVDAQITFTEVRGYMSIEYAATKKEGSDISLHLLDKDGKEFTTGNGQCMQLENGHYLWEMEMQSLAEIPESIILETHIVGESATGRIECKVEQID